MNRKNDLRLQLKRALVELESARAQRSAGVSAAELGTIEQRIHSLSAAFTSLIEKLILQSGGMQATTR
ncbi:MAG TPA: hypothetical protein VGE69_11245 [Pseudomonadales bacterium]